MDNLDNIQHCQLQMLRSNVEKICIEEVVVNQARLAIKELFFH